MSNADTFFFADFTRANYRRLLTLMKDAYPICTYDAFDPGERFLLLRHDIDFSMHAALKLAKIEQEEGVKATYFVHFHNEFYNPFERSVSDKLREIVRLGHNVGLHFDSHYFDVDAEEQLVGLLEREKGYLEDIIKQAVGVFSFHRTSPFTLGCVQNAYAGMLNVYSTFFRDEVGYCSDSNGYWRHRRLEDVLVAHTDARLQVLTHPAWWQDNVMSPRERIEWCIAGRARSTRKIYEEVLLTSGRPEIDW